MKPRSCKNKGKKLQNWVRDALFQDTILGDGDIRSTTMGEQGEDIQLSPKARSLYPFQFECKSKAKFAVYKDYEQASTHGKHTPILIIKQNNSKPLACVDAEWFINYIKEHGK